jgi:hypothetical protein
MQLKGMAGTIAVHLPLSLGDIMTLPPSRLLSPPVVSVLGMCSSPHPQGIPYLRVQHQPAGRVEVLYEALECDQHLNCTVPADGQGGGGRGS